MEEFLALMGIQINAESADQAAASMDNATEAAGRLETATGTLANEAKVAMAGLSGMSTALGDIDRRTDALKASVDPLAMSMKKTNAEMAEADALYKLGALGADEYTRYLGILEGRLETAVMAQNAMTSAQQRGQVAARLTTHEIGNMGRQFADIGVMTAMGMNPLMILIQQGPQIADIFSTAGQRGMGFKDVVVDIGKQMGILTTANAGAAASSELATGANAAQAVSAQAAAAAETELAVAANAAATAQTRLAAASGAAALGAEGAAVAAGTAAAANVAMGETAVAAATAEAIALAPVAAIILAIAAGVAVVTGLFAGGFAIGAQQINKTSESADQLQKRLGLTSDQMKKLAKDGVDTSVTMGDTFGATVDVIGEKLWEVFGPTLTDLGDNIAEFYQNAVDWALNMARETVGAIGGAVGGIKAVWGLLPAVFAEIMINAANGVIDIVERLVNSVVDKIQMLTNLANAGAMFLGFGPIFDDIEDVQIPRLNNTFEGAGKGAMESLAEGARKGREDAIAGFDATLSDIAAKARARRDARVLEGAGEAKGGGRTKREGESDEEKAYKRAVEAAEDYIEALKDEAATLNLSAIAAKEYEIAKRAAAAPTAALAQAIRDEGLALTYLMQVRAANLQQMDEQLALLALERDMIGASSRERVIALAGLAEEQRLREAGVTDEILIASAVGKRKQLAEQTYDLRTAQQAYNDELSHTANLLADIDAQARDAAQGMAQAFGKVGSAMGDVLTLMTRYAAKQEELRVRRRADGVTAEEVARIDREAARERIGYYGDLIGAAKGFFDEQSDGYKAIQAVEAGYRAWQMAVSIQATVQAMAEAAAKVTADQTAVASHVSAAATTMATDAVTTSTGIAAGAARMFAALGPYAFPVVAAMIAVMASLGAGGGGGGASVSISERRQREQGSGSVLGDAAAKSESITRSLEIVAANTNRDLEYSNDMLRALRSIDDQIGAVAAAIARSLNASGVLDTSSLKLGTTGNAPSLSNLGFGSTTTKTLKDIGLSFGSQSLADILAGGIDGTAYQVVQTKKKSTAFGITYSSSSSTKTRTSELEDELADQFTRIVASLKEGVVAAASVLGVEGAEAVLASFQVNIGKISLKDMTGAEIEETLNAVFSKLGDEMAGAAVPTLKAVQDVGEGLFETLTRVARQYQVVDVSLSAIGKTFGMVGVSSIEAREHLVDLFGSLDDFTEQVSFYSENFLTEAERLAPVQAAVNAELARLGLTSVKTREQFKAVVDGLDVSTVAGADLFAALIALAPAFAKVTEESEAMTSAKEELSRAYERESEALADSIDRFTGLAGDLRKYREGLYSGPAAALSPEAQYLATKAEFDRINGLVVSGNTSVLDDAQAAFEAFREASRTYFGSGQGYFADLDAIKAASATAESLATTQADIAEQQLEQLKSQVSVLIDIDRSVQSVADAIAAIQALMGGSPAGLAASGAGSSNSNAANDNAALVAQLQQTNQNLQELVETQQASLEQQAAISAANQKRLEAIEEQLAKQTREMQAG